MKLITTIYNLLWGDLITIPLPGGGSLGGGIALFLLNFVFAGLIGGCVLVWRLLVAAWYVPLTLYRLLTAGCACIITED